MHANPTHPTGSASLLRQMDVEAVLGRALDDRGIEVERGTELVGLVGLRGGTDPAHCHCHCHGVQVTLRSPTGIEEATCGVVAGCDGAPGASKAGAVL